jgi:hypothetical protein
MNIRLRRALMTALLVVGAVVLTGAVAGFASSSNVQTLHILTSKAKPLTTLDFGPKGKSPGDEYVFSADVLSPNGGKVIGRIRGTQTSIKLEHGFETVEGMITYELGTGNQIVIGGLSAYPLTSTGLAKGKTFVRPVLGGSGKYAGAHGEVMSKQLPDGRYDQVFKLSY